MKCNYNNIDHCQKWNDQVFGLNHLMFAVWQFFQFPSCLPFSAIHRTWQIRLWPYELLIQPSRVPELHPDRIRGLEVWQVMNIIQKHKELHRPKASIPRAVTSSQASYGAAVTEAVFRQFPTENHHHDRMCKQIFIAYPHIKHLTICIPRIRNHHGGEHSIMDIKIRQVCKLFQGWVLKKGSLPRTLVIVGSILHHIPIIMNDSAAISRLIYKHNDHRLAITAQEVVIASPSFTNLRYLSLDLRMSLTIDTSVIQQILVIPCAAQLEEYEIIGASWRHIQFFNGNLVCHVAIVFPKLKKLSLTCALLEFIGVTNPRRPILIIDQCTPHFKELQISTQIGILPESQTLLNDNQTEILYL
jgi:hypothetical protein